ncbi:MAG: DUF1294 domain-containing protein [Verrucomicrobiota bacterium]
MIPNFTGRIVEWDRAKGWGWIDTQGQRIFLHHREFAERHKRPEVGDVIRFTAGTDSNGRFCAKTAVHVNDGGRFSVSNLIFFLGLLVLPSFALVRQAGDLRLIIDGYAVAVATVTYLLYAHDKNRARAKEWRVSEGVLHFFELTGGWPGAFVAQRRLRHKCSKPGYQVVFWLIVLTHQYVALDFLLNWKLSKAAMEQIDRRSSRPGALR